MTNVTLKTVHESCRKNSMYLKTKDAIARAILVRQNGIEWQCTWMSQEVGKWLVYRIWVILGL